MLIRRIRTITTLALVTLCLTACGVRFQTDPAPTTAPTPTATPNPRTPSETGVARLIASPVLVFTSDGQPNLDFFPVPTVADVYLIAGKAVELSLPYDVIWFKTPQGTARLRFTTLTRASADDAWKSLDTSDLQFSSAGTPSRDQSTVTLSVPSDSAHTFMIRAEVELLIRPGGGGLITQAIAREFTVRVLSAPPENAAPPDSALGPAIGKLDAGQYLFDWRLWRGGPCALATDEQSPTQKKELKAACLALKVNRMDAALTALQATLADAELSQKAQLNEMIGLILVSASHYAEAAPYLDTALGAWLDADDATSAVIAMQNSAAAIGSLDSADASTRAPELWLRTLELHDQLRDPTGHAVAEANYGRSIKNTDLLNDAKRYFEAQGLPQADIISVWLNAQ